MKAVAVLFCVVALAAFGQAVRYDGYQVYRFHFTTEEQFKYLLQMKDTPNSPTLFWQLSHLEKYADLMIHPAFVQSYLERLGGRGFTSELLIEDVQKTIDAAAKPNGF